MRWSPALALLCALAAPALAAPGLERADLFEAGKEGYASYRIPGMVVTARGTVLAYCEGRVTGRNDWSDADILLRRSADGGRTWAPRRRMSRREPLAARNPVALETRLGLPDEVTFSNPAAIAARDGTIHFLFCREFDHCFYCRSADDGRSFSPPVDITAAFGALRAQFPWRVIATGPTHGIELASGRLVVPFWMSTGRSGGGFKPSAVATLFSDDQGRTWRTGAIALNSEPSWPNPTCGAIAQLGDGRVMMNARTETPVRRRVVTVSPDGADAWSAPRWDSTLQESLCEGSLASVGSAAARDQLLFANPDAKDRRRLTVRLSADDGATWNQGRVVEPGPSGYSDLGVLPDGTILCLYEWGALGGNLHKPQWLSVAPFSLAWLRAASDARR